MNTESQTDRISQLEAACAAMREALQDEQSEIIRGGRHHVEERRMGIIAAALSTDAGKSLLDRLEKSEADCAAMREALLKIGNQFREDDDIVPVYSLCKQATSTDAGKALLDRLRKSESDREELKESLALELAENIKLFDLLGLRTPGDFEHNTSTEAVTIKVKKLLDRLQAVEKERDRCKRLLESFKAFVSVTPVNPLNTWLEERDKLISNSECHVCSTCGGLLGSHYDGTPCSCIQALQPAQKEQ